MKIMESWTRAISDYTNNIGEAITYGIYGLDNGDNFLLRGSVVTIRRSDAHGADKAHSQTMRRISIEPKLKAFKRFALYASARPRRLASESWWL
jgi:hypothetical protein